MLLTLIYQLNLLVKAVAQPPQQKVLETRMVAFHEGAISHTYSNIVADKQEKNSLKDARNKIEKN